jgi:hypothetical protein
VKVDRQLGAATLGSSGMDFGDEQVDFHLPRFGIVLGGRK